DQPEQGAQPVAVVDLPDPGDEEAQHGGDTRTAHLSHLLCFAHRYAGATGSVHSARGKSRVARPAPCVRLAPIPEERAIVSELLISLALILVNGFFAGSEIAVVSLRKTRLRELVEAGSGAAKAVERLRAAPERFLATVQVGITVVGATAAAFGGASIAARLKPVLAALPLVGRFAEELSLALVVALVSYLSLVLGELVPKSLALRAAERYSLVV